MMTDTGGEAVASPFVDACRSTRVALKALVEQIKGLSVLAQETAPMSVAEGQTADAQQTEMFDNVVLALRHAEDSAMRLGKAIQAHNGGVNPNDAVDAAAVAAKDAANSEVDSAKA